MTIQYDDLLFEQTVRSLGGEYSPFFYKDLRLRYDEPHRKYHDFGHVQRMLGYLIDPIFEEAQIFAVEKQDLLVLATYYHDIVNVPGWDLNEVMSAQYAEAHMRSMGIDQGYIDQVFALIMSTKRHKPRTTHEAAICAADLYELGSDRYALNGMNVYVEFGYPDTEAWNAGRSKFLETYLNYDRLFHVPGLEDIEVRARDYMSLELAYMQLEGIKPVIVDGTGKVHRDDPAEGQPG